MTATKTGIEWTDTTWNPVTGCTKVSAGCKNCYAEKVAGRWWGDRKFTDVRCHPGRLDEPLRWRKPRRVFVNSMSDLFHEDVPDEFILQVFTVMAIAHRQTFQVLTKRPARMMQLLQSWVADDIYTYWHSFSGGPAECMGWPLPNVWLGVSCEDQKAADERIPLLLTTPAAVRFVSAEPLLGPVRLDYIGDRDDGHVTAFRPRGMREPCDTLGLDWVIVGGESGPGARGCDVQWVRRIVQDCGTAGVACFVKQLGAYAVLNPRYDQSIPGATRRLRDRKGADPDEWPEDLRVREFPEVAR